MAGGAGHFSPSSRAFCSRSSSASTPRARRRPRATSRFRTRSSVRTPRRAIPRANGTSAAPATPASRGSRPTSASTMDKLSTSRSTPPRRAYHLDIYRMGYYAGDGARKVATVQPLGDAPADSALLFERTQHGTGGLRQLERVRVLGGAGRCRLGDLLRKARARRRDIGRQPHLLHSPRRRRQIGCPVPDLRHDMAGLQPLRRQQPLRERRRQRERNLIRQGLQGQLQPPDNHARHLLGRRAVQRRIPDGPLPRAKRL